MLVDSSHTLSFADTMTDQFYWGVATSAYQAEGGYNGPGEPRTNWADAEEHGDVAVCGRAADFWTRYAEDFARCRALGCNAFRLGIEWSRCQDFDPAILDHYAAIMKSCREHGMEPVVTLHHFVHPANLGSDPWLKAETAETFAAYAVEVVACINERLDRPLHWFITINEPNMLVLNTYLGRQFPAKVGSSLQAVVTAYNHLLRGHILAYRGIHALYAERHWPRPQVSFNNYCSDVYWSDKLLLDLVSLRERGVDRHDVGQAIHREAKAFEEAFRTSNIPFHKDFAYWCGAGLKKVTQWLGRRNFDEEHLAPLLDTLYSGPDARTFDFVGLDYYDPFAAHIFRKPVIWDHEFKNKSFRAWMLASVTSKWWDWRVLPAGLGFFCRYYSEAFKRPVLIAENGLAIRRRPDNAGLAPRRDKITRSEFLRLHVREVRELRAQGVPLIGYLHWSLFDNYEWGSYTPRFGLYSLDYTQGTERAAVDPWGDNPSETYRQLISGEQT